MSKKINLSVTPEQAFDNNILKKLIAKQIKINEEKISDFKIIKKSLDARKSVKYNLTLDIATDKDKLQKHEITPNFQNVSNADKVIIVGAGPAGYFAGIQCILEGIKPIIIERGKPVEERKKDIAEINKGGKINPESNFAFGEGGAGTYSDGKLYTRSKKKTYVKKVLELLHYFGAEEKILIETQAHIGTDKLPKIISNIRKKIIECGGEIHFNTKLTDIIITDNNVKGIKTDNGDVIDTKTIILATGHSARDIYYMLDRHKVEIRAKGFAMGVRVEHPQVLIDRVQYKRKDRGDYLPPATYSIATQAGNRGVYSFCMCPGGTIVPAATSNNEIVVNGMSNSRRNSKFANSGIVVEIRPEDFADKNNPSVFDGIMFQKNLETMTKLNSGRGLVAPAQRISDFISKKISPSIPENSYQPGLVSSPLHFWLPDFFTDRLQYALKIFDKSIRGFISDEAILVGVESRTSSPVQIVRDKESHEHVSVKGLYPCGEGAGYAGGIVSAAIDGIITAENIRKK